MCVCVVDGGGGGSIEKQKKGIIQNVNTEYGRLQREGFRDPEME